MLDVVCVKWGTEFSDDYVHILKAMVARNTTIEYNFVCFSDNIIDGIDTRWLPDGLNGWWNKLYLFSEKAALSERVVYFDLDTIITDNIDWLLSYDGLMMGIENLGVNNRFENPEAYANRFQSGIMAWNQKENTPIWKLFEAHQDDIVKKFYGDGEFLHYIFQHTGNKPDLVQHIYPNKLRSYKYQCYDEGLVPGTAIVCFHGVPRPHQAISETTYPWGIEFIPSPWVGDYWKL